jgi:methylated-DNA-protein-cysteine methyltransferase related protein
MKSKTTAKSVTPFTANVIRLIKAIPAGKVATYGQVAKLAGKPHGARGVSWILSSCSSAYGLPWFRVIGSKGGISIPWGTPSYQKQQRLLKEEGVSVAENGRVDLDRFQWKPKSKAISLVRSESKSRNCPA